MAIAGVVILANATYLLGIFNPNPINQVSGLGHILTPGLLAGQNNIDPNIGFTAQAFGHLAAMDWLHGHIPWWNPFEGIGAPLAGEMQGAALFPLTVFNLMPNGQVFFRLALEFLAGLGAYLLIRRFTDSETPAVVGGIAFALNGTFAWMFHAPGNPVAFLPFMLLGIEWAREGASENVRRGWALLALALALAIYAGFPEVAFIDGLLACVWLIVRASSLPRTALLTLATSIGIGVVVGLLLAAPILVAFVGYLPYADVGGHAGAFAHASLSSTTALPAQIMPYLFGPIFGFTSQNPTQLMDFWGNIGGFLGVSMTTLALIGVVGKSYRSLRVALGVWVTLGLLRLVGVNWALDIVNAIPGVKSTAFYRYAPPSWEFSVTVLAALGLNDLIRRRTSKPVVIGSGAVMFALTLVSWHAAQPVFRGLVGVAHNRAWALASLVWALAVTLGIVALALVPAAIRGRGQLDGLRRGALAGLVLVDVFAMFVVPQFSAPRQAAIDTRPVAFLQHHLGQSRFFTLGPVAPDYGSYFGIGSVAVNDVPLPNSYAKYVQTQLDPNVDPLVFTGTVARDPAGLTPAQELVVHLPSYEALGVKYVVVGSGTALPGLHLKKVFEDATARIFELPHPASLFSESGTPHTCTVRVVAQTTADVDCKRRGVLVYRETSMPGWYATANGHPLAIHSGSLFQSVTVPAGRSVVVFTYAPPHVDVAWVAFGLGLAVLFVAALRFRGLRRGRRGSPRPRFSGL